LAQQRRLQPWSRENLGSDCAERKGVKILRGHEPNPRKNRESKITYSGMSKI
jgi:hypothetical protein